MTTKSAVLAALVVLSACGPRRDDSPNAQTADAKISRNAVDLSLTQSALPLRGVSLSGAEFGTDLPGTFGYTYTYPTHAEVDYFVAKGMTIFRLPFLWERLQPQAYGELSGAELSRLDDMVTYITTKGARALIDPHNYARYYGQALGSGVSDAAFADFWHRLALHYASNANAVFGLMNEPHDLPTEQWEAAAQSGVTAIRSAGALNLILVPGNSWTGAHAWTKSFYGTPNSVAMLNIKDPANNYAYEVHQYLDSDSSGTHAGCVSNTVGSEAMAEFTAWLRQNHQRGFLGEFAGANNPTCRAAVDDLLHHLETNADVYLGWTWWAAGPWWGNYMYSIEPSNNFNSGLMDLLSTHLQHH